MIKSTEPTNVKFTVANIDQEPIEMTCAREHATLYKAKAAHSIFSYSLYGHAVLIRSCFSGANNKFIP